MGGADDELAVNPHLDLVSTLTQVPGVLEQGPAVPRCVQSFDFAMTKELKTRSPATRSVGWGPPKVVNLPALATWADQTNPQHRSVNRVLLEEVHRQGMPCLVWTVDAPDTMGRAARLGEDGVITNRPARLVAVPSGRMLSGGPSRRSTWALYFFL